MIRNSVNQITPKFKLLLQVEDPDLYAMYNEKVNKWNENVLNSKYVDSGFDLFMPTTVSFVHPSTQYPLTQLVNLKVKAAVYTNTSSPIPCAYTLNVRSSIYKTKFRLANNVGIIDSGYRGNLMTAVDCWDTTQVMEKHNRYFQICMPTLEPFIIELVKTLDITERGEGGHGSTGR
jgi:dUTP pyrophosphatase